VTAGGHAGKVDEGLVQKPALVWPAVSKPHATTDTSAAPKATAMADQYLLRTVNDLLPKAHALPAARNGMTPPQATFVSDFFQQYSAPASAADMASRLPGRA
jgi:hypothetical protein